MSKRYHLSDEEVRQLKQAVSKGKLTQEQRDAILQLEGSSLRTVARKFGRSESTISNWWKKWEEVKLKNQLEYAQNQLEYAQKERDAYRDAYRDLNKAGELSPDNIERLKTIQSLLPVIDDFDRAFENRPEDIGDNPWTAGVEMTKSNFEKWLKKHQIEAIDPAPGKPFDPNFHKQVSIQDSDEVESDHVIKTLQKGYRSGEIVLRDALVLTAR